MGACVWYYVLVCSRAYYLLVSSLYSCIIEMCMKVMRTLISAEIVVKTDDLCIHVYYVF